MEELLLNNELIEENNIKVYKLEKFNVLSCNNEKNIILNKEERINYSLCNE